MRQFSVAPRPVLERMICGGIFQGNAPNARVDCAVVYFDVVQAACFDVPKQAVHDTPSGEASTRDMFVLAPEVVDSWMDTPCAQWVHGRQVDAMTCRNVIQGWARTLMLDPSCPPVAIAVLSPLELCIARGVFSTLALGSRRTNRSIVAALLMAGLDEAKRVRREQRVQHRARRRAGNDEDLFLGELADTPAPSAPSQVVPAEPLSGSFAPAEVDGGPPPAPEPPTLQVSHFVDLALDLRKHSAAILDSFEGWEREAQVARLESSVEWLDSMVRVLSAPGLMGAEHIRETCKGGRNWRYTIRGLLQALFLASNLRNVSNLKPVLVSAMALALPEDMVEMAQTDIANAPLPGQSS